MVPRDVTRALPSAREAWLSVGGSWQGVCALHARARSCRVLSSTVSSRLVEGGGEPGRWEERVAETPDWALLFVLVLVLHLHHVMNATRTCPGVRGNDT